jgi:hypothetical protein
MIDLLQQCRPPITEWLQHRADAVEAAGRGRWKFALSGRASLRGTARLEDDWLLLEAPSSGGRRPKRLTPERLERLLQYNAELRGGAKFGLGGDPPQVVLSAEIPTDLDQVELESRLAEAFVGFRQGRLKSSRKRAHHAAEPEVAWNVHDGQDPDGQDPEGPTDRDLSRLCEEAGWPFAERASGRVAVQLDVRDQFYQALMERTWAGGLRLWVELGNDVSDAASSRFAVSVLLLSACRAVRMARAAATPVNGVTAYCWEVSLGDAAGSRELQHALASLSVACRVSAREVQALQHEAIARHYLMVRGWSSYLPETGS